MLNFSSLIGFEWDEGNSRKSSDKHSVSQAEAEQIFADAALLVAPDQKHSHAEPRFHALGRAANGHLLQVAFTLREDNAKIRVISARPMNRKERAIYEAKA
jgi:uncharacterized DUF497 family protein